MVSFSDQLVSLQHLISRLLPSSAESDVPSCLAAAVCRACQLSFHSLHPDEQAKDHIWNILRSASISPSPSQINDVFTLVEKIHQQSKNQLNRFALPEHDTRLSEWNDTAASFYEQMVLTADVGSRIHDPRQTQPYASNSQSSSSQTSTATPHSRDPASFAQHSHQNSTPSSSSKISGFDAAWLRNRCAQMAVCQVGDSTAHELAFSIMLLLCDQTLTDDHLQSDLYDCFGGDFDAVADVLQKRSQVVSNRDAITADYEKAMEIHEHGGNLPPSQSQQQQQQLENAQNRLRGVSGRRSGRQQQRQKHRQQQHEDEYEEDAVMEAQNLGGSAFEERQRAFPGVQLQSDSMIGSVERVGLPKGSTREVGKGYEEIFIPPPQRKPILENELVDVSTGLGEHPELLIAMKGMKKLNRLQSAVFPTAFKSDENMLVCAPTGAGKTNVALLTIFREIVSVKLREKRNFKVVYVAPMKALASEVTEKFSQRLGPLGLSVREFTGDISPSRAETIATHVLVTTPEKWDVVTRKTGSEVGESLTLFIIDEIHLLHDERGAVLESIVARTLRFSETAQRPIRLVGLSATLPNYNDVGSFMRVNPEKGLFHFDGSHRPVPLSQTFIGISEGGNSNTVQNRKLKENKVHEMAWKKVKDSLQRGHQAMIFVHSRKGTANAAREMINRANEDCIGDIFLGGQSKNPGKEDEPSLRLNFDGEGEDEGRGVMPPWAAKEISKSKTGDIRELCLRGVGIHNAGLPRSDRKLVEKLFAEGVLRLLCSTATLAWGVNLPARTVVIMGTEVYNAEKGGFVQLGMLDVMQIFGRAGRPQFDTEGEGSIITDHEHLSKYLNLLTSSIPIESQLGASASRLADHLNAEIVSGTVSSIGDGVKWLNYTYLSVRMPQNPLVYGINWADVQADSGLHSHRASLIDLAAKALDDARMCRYDRRTGMLSPLDLGRVSSHFYVSHETIVLWSEQFANFTHGPAITQRVYGTVIHAVSSATEFEHMRSREEEGEELEYLTRHACPIPLKAGYGSETREGKVAILLQAHISRAQIRMSDLSYIVQSATRLLRALFEISLRRGMPSFSVAALELARASESRIWPFQHPLWQFTYLARRERSLVITPETIAAIESSGKENDLTTLRTRSRDELAELIRAPRIVQTVEKVLNAIPTLEIIEAKVAPLSNTLLSVHVKLVATFTWNDVLHGHLESWWLWIEDKEENRIYHSQKVQLTKRQVQELNIDIREGGGNNSNSIESDHQKRQSIDINLTVAVFDPPSAQYWVRVESDRWHTGGGSTANLSVASMQLPHEASYKTDISRITPSNVTASTTGLRPDEIEWFNSQFTQFSTAQTCMLHTARYTDDNMLICAPSGCGDVTMAELTMMRAFQRRPNATVVVISLQKGALYKLEKSWKKTFCHKFGHRGLLIMDEVDMSVTADELAEHSIILSTPFVWNEFMQNMDGGENEIFKHLSMFIIMDLHRLSDVSNIGTELLISRLCQYRRGQGAKHRINTGVDDDKKGRDIPRIVSFSGVIPNPLQLAEWLGVSRKLGLFCFGDEARQVPIETYLVSVAGERYSSRMQSINRPLYSTIQRHSFKKPVLIFVSSRRQSLFTARDLLRLASLDNKEDMFIGSNSSANMDTTRHLRSLSDIGLQQVAPHGIGLYHESMTIKEVSSVESLFEIGRMLVVVSTFGMASRMPESLRGHSVILKGTENFDGKRKRFEDIPVADVVQMIGRAGRYGSGSTGYATIFVHEPRQTLFKKLVHEPLPIESGLVNNMDDGSIVIEDVLLKEVVNGRFVDDGGIEREGLEWFKNLLIYQRLWTNPGWYGLKKSTVRKREKTGMDISTFETERRFEFCNNLIMTAMRRLELLGCVMLTASVSTGRGGGGGNRKKSAKVPMALGTATMVKETELGKMCVRWRISAESGQKLCEQFRKLSSINGGGGFEEVMNALSTCEELCELGKEHEEDAVWLRIFERVVNKYVECGMYKNKDLAGRDMKLNGWMESSQKRGKLLCYNIFVRDNGKNGRGNGSFKERGRERDEMKWRNEMVSGLLKRIVNFVLDIVLNQVIGKETKGMLEIVKQVVNVRQSVSMKSVWSDDFWNVCGFEGMKVSVVGRKEGWKTVKDVMEKGQEFSMFVARVCEEGERGVIMRQAEAYPKLKISKVNVNGQVSKSIVEIEIGVTGGDGGGVAVVAVVWLLDSGRMIGGKRVIVGDINGNQCGMVRVGTGGGEVMSIINLDIDVSIDDASKVGTWIGCEDYIGSEALVTTD